MNQVIRDLKSELSSTKKKAKEDRQKLAKCPKIKKEKIQALIIMNEVVENNRSKVGRLNKGVEAIGKMKEHLMAKEENLGKIEENHGKIKEYLKTWEENLEARDRLTEEIQKGVDQLLDKVKKATSVGDIMEEPTQDGMVETREIECLTDDVYAEDMNGWAGF